MPKKAPVEKVGGPRDRGPWPSDVDEIVEGKEYRRPVPADNGILQDVPVTVSNIQGIGEDGEGRAVSYTWSEP